MSESTPAKLRSSQNRRNDLTDRGLCLNGESHGNATHGVRCYRCSLVHRYGVRRAEMILETEQLVLKQMSAPTEGNEQCRTGNP